MGGQQTIENQKHDVRQTPTMGQVSRLHSEASALFVEGYLFVPLREQWTGFYILRSEAFCIS
eukprot:scaffold8070_cov117-Cylindrotheca_fusiformis.AAC.3